VPLDSSLTMKKTKCITLLAGAMAALALVHLVGAAEDAPIDFGRAQQIFNRKKAGETLSADDQAYLQKAMQLRASRSKGGKGGGTPANASTTPVSDPIIVKGLVPLDELQGAYKGEDGGLYGGGRNTPPEAHLAAYRKESEKIRPLDGEGKPSEGGRIVLLSLGMSNTTMEFSEFVKVANADAKKSPQLVVVDGAIGARTATVWALDGGALLPAGEKERLKKLMETTGRKAHEADTWPTVEKRLQENGVTARQVQAIWIKQAEASPARLGAFPDHARVLEENLIDMLMIAKERYPNLRVVYLSSRIFGGYATSHLNPEPYAYEEAFAMRWIIRKQMEGDPRLNFDPGRGPVKAPLVVWGPYLWANGATARKSDGLTWQEEDFVTTDHTHPSPTARKKVADLLLKFFESDPEARRWFANPAAQAVK
jgi:hypothetical protein